MGDARAAWAHWSNTRQWQITRSENRLVMIEGQPDRYPGTDEPIELWLDGHCGSFRSFEIVRDAATRPVKGPSFVNSLCICGAIRCSIANGSRSASDDFRNGNDQFTDTICAAMGVGQWQRLVGRPDLVGRFLNNIAIPHVVV